MSTPSQTFTLWAAAWLGGAAAPDDVVDAMAEWSPMHLPSAIELLSAVRATTSDPAAIGLVLPAAGDPRGLPTGTEFARLSQFAGEGVLCGTPGEAGIGIVPVLRGPEALTWEIEHVTIPRDNGLDVTLGEAEYTLREAVRTSAGTVAELHRSTVTDTDIDPYAEVERVRDELSRHRLPQSVSSRAARVLSLADNVSAILTVARAYSVTAPTSARAAQLSDDALRPLDAAVRNARRCACKY